MPAPPEKLVTALRAGAAQRHLLFRMEHSQGTVLAWDGVGELEFEGEVYLGVGGLADIRGVSESGDLQNHEIELTLNGVALPSLIGVDPYVRGKAAVVQAVWLSESGGTVASRVVFSGTADVLRLKADEESRSLTVKLRAALAEWRTPPRAYYTNSDQQRRYPGDTGFRFVKGLENAIVTGWSRDKESSGGRPILIVDGAFAARAYDSVDFEWVGDAEAGNGLGPGPGSRFGVFTLGLYEEEESGAPATVADDGTIQVGGLNTYIDVNGDVRSAGGKKLLAGGDPDHWLRKQTFVDSVGTATSTDIEQDDSILQIAGGSGSAAKVYCNDFRHEVILLGASVQNQHGATYADAVTGDPATIVSGFLEVNGSRVKLSSTGALITAAGNFITPQGGSFEPDGDSSRWFLRTWT